MGVASRLQSLLPLQVLQTPPGASGQPANSGSEVPVQELREHLDRHGSLDTFLKLHPSFAGQAVVEAGDHLRTTAARESLEAQLQQLNERARWYSGQAWQMPFVYLGATAVLVGTLASGSPSRLVTGVALSVAGLVAIPVLYHIDAVADGSNRAVTNLQAVERALGLTLASLHRGRRIWFPLWAAAALVGLLLLTAGVGVLMGWLSL